MCTILACSLFHQPAMVLIPMTETKPMKFAHIYSSTSLENLTYFTDSLQGPGWLWNWWKNLFQKSLQKNIRQWFSKLQFHFCNHRLLFKLYLIGETGLFWEPIKCFYLACLLNTIVIAQGLVPETPLCSEVLSSYPIYFHWSNPSFVVQMKTEFATYFPPVLAEK